MAITGKSYVPISENQRAAGTPDIEVIAESSSQTALRGAAVLITSGYVVQCGANPALVYGFLESAASNGASNGAKNARVLRALPGKKFVGSLETASFTQAMVGSVANLVAGSSTWYLDTSTSISSAAQCVILGLAKSFAVGDADPEVIFTIDPSFIQFGS